MFGYGAPAYPAGGYYSASYAPSYGYGGGCCNTGYSASYATFPSSGCCGTCDTGCSSCGSGCVGSGCVGTEIRSRPEPDDSFDDRDRRTFGDEADPRDRNDDYDDRRPARDIDDPLDPLDPLRDDSFGRPNRDPIEDDSFGRSNRDPIDEWDPTDRGGVRKPAIEDGMIDDTMGEPVDRSSRKPPITAPVGEEGPAGESTESDRDPSDVVPASEEDTTTTSFRDVRSFVRLAGVSSSKVKTRTARQVSSSRQKQQTPRWIGAPAPTGRVRL